MYILLFLLQLSRLAKERQLQTLAKAMEQMQFESRSVKSIDEAKKKQFEFWDTQPVPKLDEDVVGANEEMTPDKEMGELRQEPYSLPAGFHWDTLNLQDPLIV